MNVRRIVIVGGGFAGVKTALLLSKKNLPNTKITLISDRYNFEYHGALYRLVTGGSPIEVCIPIREILSERKVEFILDAIVNINDDAQEVQGSSGSKYHYDKLVLGLGSVTNYFNVPGLEKYSHGMKTIDNALRLKNHIQASLKRCVSESKDQQLRSAKFVVVGGGATGVELSASLITYAREYARSIQLDPSIVAVSLIESAPRLLPAMPEDVSKRVEAHVRVLGVNVHLNRLVEKEDLVGVSMCDMEIRSGTVIWTAGVAAHPLHRDLSHGAFDSVGKVHVDQYQIALGYENVFVLGDGAATEYSGMAQTALAHAHLVSRAIAKDVQSTGVRRVTDPRPIWAIPVGRRWAASIFGPFTLYGYSGWFFRRVADMFVFASFLPLRKAITLFRSK